MHKRQRDLFPEIWDGVSFFEAGWEHDIPMSEYELDNLTPWYETKLRHDMSNLERSATLCIVRAFCSASTSPRAFTLFEFEKAAKGLHGDTSLQFRFRKSNLGGACSREFCDNARPSKDFQAMLKKLLKIQVLSIVDGGNGDKSKLYKLRDERFAQWFHYRQERPIR